MAVERGIEIAIVTPYVDGFKYCFFCFAAGSFPSLLQLQ